MCGVRIAKIVSSFSLLVLAALAICGDYRDLQAKIANLKDPKEVAQAIRSVSGLTTRDTDLAEAVDSLASNDGDETVEDVKAMIALRADSEPPATLLTDTSNQIREIKSSNLYRDPGVQDESNWLDGALKRLADLIPRPQMKMNAPSGTISPMGGFLIPMMWGLLALAVLVFGYFAIRHFQWKGALRRKARAMLEDDEPERTLDEWLLLADQLASQGRYREAVRAMYLSCLLKFDEAGIARFIRGETNWEHLSRIQASPKRPATIDFLPPTRLFDHVWYGHHVRGLADIDEFKAWYGQITEILRGVGK